jgi:hypothetical protein
MHPFLRLRKSTGICDIGTSASDALVSDAQRKTEPVCAPHVG